MDLLAATALVLIFEGLALAIFAGSLPQVLAEIERLGPRALRLIGLAGMAVGALLYLLVRGGPGAA